MQFTIITPYGDRYTVNEKGEISKEGVSPSGQWKMAGLASTKGFAFGQMVVRFERLADWLKTNPDLTFKNGSPRYTVVDLDHGTQRVWGNTKYHGISNIYATV